MFKFNSIHFVIKTFHLLANHQPKRLLLIFLLTLLMGVNAGFSIMLLIPLLQLLNVSGDAVYQGQSILLNQLVAKLGVSLNIEKVLFIYVVLLTITALLNYLKAILDTGYQQTFIYEIRRRLFRKIILADWAFLNSKSKTNHLQVLTKEIPNLANYIFFYLRLLCSLIITAIYVTYAMIVSIKFTLLIVVAGLLIFFLLRKFLTKAFLLGENAVQSYNHLLKYIDNFWQTVKIAKVHSSEAYYFKKFEEANKSLLDLEVRMQKNNSLPQLIYSITGIAVLVLVVYVGYKTDHVLLASLLTLILLFSRIFPQFTGINTDVNMILSNVASVKLVLQLDEEFQETAFHNPLLLHAIELEKDIRFENLQFAYPGGVFLLEDFSETIPAKKITGIIGESGNGKTTLIDLIAGLQKPAFGKILIDGKKIEEDMLPYWKSSIGYLPQDSFFIDGTFRENLVWDSVGEISDEAIFNVLEKVNALHLVKRFKNKLDEFIVNYPFSFSGGECQRLALARVLLRKPRLLLLDEATSSLDTENEKQIMEVLSKLRSSMTIIFVTHRTGLVSFFDKVIMI